jgi:signal transduction histidine kinase
MELVLAELLDNAIHAGAGSAVLLTVKHQDDGSARVAIRDDGPGMATDVLQQACDPFYSGWGGTGLGLSIASVLVDQQGGSLELWSEQGNGCCCTVSLATASSK